MYSGRSAGGEAFAVGCQGVVRQGPGLELEKNIASRHKSETFMCLHLELFIFWQCTMSLLIGSKHYVMPVLKNTFDLL